MSNKPKFKIGDRVRVLPNGPQLEDYYGTWVHNMNGDIGKEYTVKGILFPDITKEEIGPFYGYTLKGTRWTFDERNLELVEQEVTKKKPKFKVGDKVRVLPNGKQLKNYRGGGWVPKMNRYINKEFFIQKIIPPKESIHGCHYGYLLKGDIIYIFDERNLELAKEKKEEPANIIFKFKKNKIIAKREGGLKATASCHPDDKYDISLGMCIAVERLFDKEKKAKERATTPIEGFYMCTRSDNQFSSGNIYKFKDGLVKSDYGTFSGPYKEIQKHNKTVYIDKAIFEEIKWEYA